MKNKIVALMLGMVMIVSALTGCGNDAEKTSSSPEEEKETSVEKEVESDEASSEEEEPLKIKIIYYNQAGFPGIDGTPTQEYIEERFNVDFEVVPIDVLNAEQYSLFLAQGETADVYTIGNTGVHNELFEQGMVREISYEDMWEYMPTYMQNCADNCGGEEILSKIIKQSGKYTRIPYTASAIADCGMMIVRKDWLDKVGIAPEEINSLEALEKVMHAFTYDDPDGNGVDDTHALTAGNGMFRFGYVHGAYMAKPDSYTLEDGQVTATFTLDRYKECLQLLNKWYEAGYFTSEAATDDRGAERAKWAAGQIGIIFDTYGWCCAGESGVIGMVEAVNPDAEFAYIPGFAGPYGGGTLQAEVVQQGGDGTVMFDADCSDEIVHKIMEIKEALVTDPELYIRTNVGVEGEDYIVDEDGYIVVETP